MNWIELQELMVRMARLLGAGEERAKEEMERVLELEQELTKFTKWGTHTSGAKIREFLKIF